MEVGIYHVSLLIFEDLATLVRDIVTIKVVERFFLL